MVYYIVFKKNIKLKVKSFDSLYENLYYFLYKK